MFEWSDRSNYGTEIRVEAWPNDEIYLGSGMDGGYLSAETAKKLRKALKRAIKEAKGR